LRLIARWLAIASTAAMICASGARGQESGKELTVEKIFGHGPLTGTPPTGLAWSPDAQHLTYIAEARSETRSTSG